MLKHLRIEKSAPLLSIAALLGGLGCGASDDEAESTSDIAETSSTLLWSTDTSYERAGIPWTNSSAAGLTIRLHFVALADDNGSNAATVDPTFIRGIVELANATYASAKIQFAFDSARDYETVNNTGLNSLANGSGSWWVTPNNYAAQRPGKLVIFLRKGTGNAFAYPPDTGAPIPSSAPLPTSDVNFVAWYGNRAHADFWKFNFMHEIGHYLGLFHTHPTFGEPFGSSAHSQAISQGNAAYFDGDLLSDTPIDPAPAYVASMTANHDMCADPFSFGTFGTHPLVFAPPYQNIMSYYHCPNETITPQQAQLMRDTLGHTTRLRLLKAQPQQQRLLRLRPSDEGAGILLHNPDSGSMQIHLPNGSGEFGAPTFTVPHVFCAGDKQSLYRADFNGDGRTDLMCHDVVSGNLYLDTASTADGSTQPYAGVNWTGEPYCSGAANRLFIGRFNSDARTDLMCMNLSSGVRTFRYAKTNGTFEIALPTAADSWSTSDTWCRGDSKSLHIGDFNGDARDDLLCHDVISGSLHIDTASSTGQFLGTNWSKSVAFCKDPGLYVLVGNFDGVRGDDLLCHNPVAGDLWELYADSAGTFENALEHDAPWCKAVGARLYVGDVNGDARDDLVCSNETTRKISVDYANTSGGFAGTNWDTSTSWIPLGSIDLK